MGKLVRDKIPQIMRNNNKDPNYRVMDKDEYRRELYRKLGEEFREYRQASDYLGKVEELADLLTVIKGIVDMDNILIDDVVSKAKSKNLEKGEFVERFYLDNTQKP